MSDISELREVFGWNPDTGEIWWVAHPSRESRATGMAGTKNSNGYICIKYAGRRFVAHRLIWALHFGVWPDGMIDHKNRKRDDNRIENLRIVTASQNQYNAVGFGKSSSFKGVYWHSGQQCWRARIGFEKRRIDLGNFTSELEAAMAYDQSAAVLHGEWALLNFPKLKGAGDA